MIACACKKRDVCKFPMLRIEGGKYPMLAATLNTGEEVMMYVDANGLVALINAAKAALVEMVTA